MIYKGFLQKYTKTGRAKIELYHADCRDMLPQIPDNYYELAIVDPPYNVGASDGMFGGHPGSYRKDLKHYAKHNETPDNKYFVELFRISENQIIWGSNYYPQYLFHSGAIIWLKKTSGILSDAEIAFQSYSKLVKVIKYNWNGFIKEKSDRNIKRIHPNQKPTGLYKWLLKNYAKQGDKILDTHIGSGSIAIACWDMGFDLTGFELDGDYYKAMIDRFEMHTRQLQFDI